MDAAAAETAAKKSTKLPYIPHELVTLILIRLPVESLVRLSCVCKEWRSTVSGDASFRRAHLRLQKPFLLFSPRFVPDVRMTKIVLYRFEENQQQGTTPPIVHAMDPSSQEPMHEFAHCNGLVLLPGEVTVRVLNPSTHRALTLPGSRATEPPHIEPFCSFDPIHQAFGLGHDPRSDAYKVARFFYRFEYWPTTGEYRRIDRMEVFTIGSDRHWRETAEHPPYPILTWRKKPATYFKGSLIWTVDMNTPPVFLRFRLDDETFVVMPPPPCYPRGRAVVGYPNFASFDLSELHGELCLAREGGDINMIEMWMCDNIDNPQWDQRYKIKVSTYKPPYFNPIAILDDKIVFKERYSSIRRYDLKTKTYKDVFYMDGLRYHSPVIGALGLPYFHVIPYIPSLIPV